MKKGEKRKQELIGIAYRMFVSKGYEHTSVDDIIREAGIAKGTCYYYFKSKEQMLEEVIEMMLQAEAEKAKAVLRADLSVPEKIAGIETEIAQIIQTDDLAVRVYFSPEGLPAAASFIDRGAETITCTITQWTQSEKENFDEPDDSNLGGDQSQHPGA